MTKTTKTVTEKPKKADVNIRVRALRRFMIAGFGSMFLAGVMVVAGHTLFKNHAGNPEAVLQNVWQALAAHDGPRMEKLIDKNAVINSIVEQVVSIDADSRPDGGMYALNMLQLLAPEVEIALHAQMEAFIRTGTFLKSVNGNPSVLELIWQEVTATPNVLDDVVVGKARKGATSVTLRLNVANNAEPLSLVIGLTQDAETWRVSSIGNLRPFIDGIYRARIQRADLLNAPLLNTMAEHLTFNNITLLPADAGEDAPLNIRTLVANMGERGVVGFQARLTALHPETGPVYSTDIYYTSTTPLLKGNAVDKTWPLGLRRGASLPASATFVIEPFSLTFDTGEELKLHTPNDL